MKKKLLLALASIIMSSGIIMAATHDASIEIDSRVKFQHVTGFGGFSPSPQWSYWLGDAEMDKLFGTGEGQLGLNILRLYMANNRNGWSSGVANAKRAKKYGAFIFASPWSPPGEWKTNNSDSNGGELLESRYKDWANFLNGYYLYMKEQGVEIDAVSIQNEPDWNTSYQSCIWSGEKMAKFLRDYGSLIECKVIAPEAVHFSRNMHEPILNDEYACEHLDILGGHFYGWDGSSYPIAAQKGKEVWMTEYLINERQNNNHLDINWIDDGFLFARSVNDAMLANMSAWVHYSLKRFYGCLGDGEYGTTNNVITKRGYILSHYAKYVAGTTRVRHSLNDDTGRLTSSAYITESGDSLILMVINQGPDSYNLAVELPFYSKKGRSIVTTETQNMIKRPISMSEETYEPALNVKPYSVNTYILEKSSVRHDIDDESTNGELIFADNFDLYGASCIPPGWRSKSDGEWRYAGNYSLGPRVMSFSPEGKMNYGFYFRSSTSAVAHISYGEDPSSRLQLQPGDYKLTFSTVGWKATPQVTARVLKVGTHGDGIAYTDATPETFVSSNGSGSRINHTSDFELCFTIEEAYNFILKWEVAKASSGMNEALLGNVRLVRVNTDGVEDVIIDQAQDQFDGVMYDILGRPVVNPNRPGVYIQNGKKVIK